MFIKTIKIIIFFVLVAPIFFIQALNIDTRFESNTADKDKARVYINQQPFNPGEATYGSVEFSTGIVIYGPENANTQITLGVTPPLSGEIRLSYPTVIGAPSAYTINTAHDLILNCTAFTMWSRGALALGDGTFNINNQNSVFLNRDITVPNNASLAFSSGSNGILNGLGNSFILSNNPAFGFGFLSLSANPPSGLTVKNINFIGAAGVQTDSLFVFAGDSTLTFENVQITIFGSAVYLPLDNGAITFSGQNNTLGNGGYFQFSNYDFFSSAAVTLATETQVHVLPDTTLNLAQFAGGPLSFVFTDKSSQLYLDNCTVQLGSNLFQGAPFAGDIVNMVFTNGTVIVNGTVTLQAGIPGSSLQLGDGVNQVNNCDLIILPGSKLIVDNGMTFSNKNV